MDSQRCRRVASLVRSTIASSLIEDIDEPLLDGVTICDVTVSKDLKNARVYYRGLEHNVEEADVQEAWKYANQFFSKRLTHLSMKNVPRLSFHLDETGIAADRVLSLLDELKSQDAGGTQ